MDPALPSHGRRWKLRFAALLSGMTLLIVIPATSASALSKPGCAGWHYDNIVRQTDSLKTLLGPYSFTNNTSHDATFSLTRTVSGSASLTTSVSVSASADFFVGKVEAKTGIDVSTSLTVSASVTGSTIVPPHYIGYLSFGIVRIVTSGQLTYRDGLCGILQNYGTVKVWAPAHEGFVAWEEHT
jgi:hypothetical protein